MKKPSDPDIRAALRFLRGLRAINNREWFALHKEEYNAAMESRNALTETLIREIAAFDPAAARLSVKDCTYRLYRDVRFSADKSPYKTHIGIFINPPKGKKSILSGYYFHIEPDNSFVCAGTIGWNGKVLAAVRRAVYDNIDEYRGIVESPGFRKCFPLLGDSPVKTAPKGFTVKWEYIDYIRPRNFMAASLQDDSLFKGDIAEIAQRMKPYIEQGKKFNDFINYTVEDFEPDM